MIRDKIKLLDCTLRDGGYINEWDWGYRSAQTIISLISRANIDIIEVGFLRNVEKEDARKTVGNTVGFLNGFLPEKKYRNIIYAAMVMQSNYDINKLEPYSGEGIELIRVTAHNYDIFKGLEFAGKVMEKGYLVSFNPINIMGYSDRELIDILDKVNELMPYQFSVVDTFGCMRLKDMNRIVDFVDNNLRPEIQLGLHLHENMSLSYAMAQMLVEKNMRRGITIDGSLMGMGRTPGNLPLELIASYLNESRETNYDLDYLMDAIQEYIAPYKGESAWGYSTAYFLSAKYNLHRNYAEYYLAKGNLTTKNINLLLSKIEEQKKAVYDENYAEKLYYNFLESEINDEASLEKLKEIIGDKKILILAPGMTINLYKEQLRDYIKQNTPLVIAVNFIPNKELYCDFYFFSNNKRLNLFDYIDKKKLIVTSNVRGVEDGYIINFNNLSSTGEFANGLTLLLELIKKLDVFDVSLAGADGHNETGYSYADDSLQIRNSNYNRNDLVKKYLEKLNMKLEFITPSAYE